ncbi:MAG: DegT/DnrJ/EryC1/StrS aminotransferase family protein [Chloroflexi bacterium]|nr:DegT/DnrJ/EryC1/StrS aminotransferase family protein [Chloroflexota bacterium]
MTYLPPDPPLTVADLPGLLRSAPLPEQFYASGRAALLAGLRALGVGPGDEVLLPAYLCESVITPVEAVGARPTFYPVGRGLEVDPDAVEAALTERTRAVVIIHYLGFPGPVQALRDLCDRRGLALVEDCAHALYSRLGDRDLGSWGDLAIFSPWKSLPLPDGGLLRVNRPDLMATAPATGPAARRVAFRLAYRALGSVEQLLGWSPRTRLLRRQSLRASMHQQVSAGPVDEQAGSEAAWRLLQAARPAFVVGRRRRHFARLLAACHNLAWATPVFTELPEGVCPLGLPLAAEDRDHWRDILLGRGVNVRTYWEHLPPAVDTAHFPEAAWLRDRILVLPVHQGLTNEGVEWLARLLQSLGKRT